MAKGLRKSPPLTYQVVEYIKGDGVGGYIPTGYYSNNNTQIYGVGYFDNQSTSIVESNFSVWWPSWNAAGYLIAYNSTYMGGFLSNNWDAGNSSISNILRYRVKFERWTNIKGSSGIRFEDNIGNGRVMSVGFDATTKGVFTSPYESVIFAGVNQNGISEFSSERLYILRVYENDILIHDFIPCYRKLDGKVGVYDIIDNVFHEAIGTVTYG